MATKAWLMCLRTVHGTNKCIECVLGVCANCKHTPMCTTYWEVILCTYLYLMMTDEVAQFYWLLFVYCDVTAFVILLFGHHLLLCDVAISDWIRGDNNWPYINHVARHTGSSTLDVISSMPISFDALNCVLDISEVCDLFQYTHQHQQRPLFVDKKYTMWCSYQYKHISCDKKSMIFIDMWTGMK